MAVRVPILMYHQISPDVVAAFRKYTVHPNAFRAHLGWLARAGYRPIGLDDVLAARAGGPPLPGRPVVITIDDGFRDAVELARPLLAERGFRATFFVVGGLIGRTSEWLAAELGVELPLADGPSLRKLADQGFSIGSHGLTHPHLTRLSSADQARELRDSRSRVEEAVGRTVLDLAYPHGESDTAVRQAAIDAGYRSAVTTRQASASQADDVYSLPRIIVDGRDRLVDVAVRLRAAESAGALLRRGPLDAARRFWRGA